MPEQASTRKDAALAGFDAVEHDFTAVWSALGNPHAALDKQRKATTRLRRVEQNAAGGRASYSDLDFCRLGRQSPCQEKGGR